MTAMYARSRRKRLSSLALAFVSLTTFVASIFSPWLTGMSSAASTPGGITNLNIFKRMTKNSNPTYIGKQPGQTCYGVTSTLPKTQGNLLAEIFPNQQTLDAMYDPNTNANHITNGVISTKVGTFKDNFDNNTRAQQNNNGYFNFTDLYHVTRDPGDLQIITFKEGGL